MKIRILAGFAIAAVLWGQDAPGRVARLSYIFGQVSFRPGNVEEWAPATLNYPLTNGDHLWTDADAQAEVVVGLTAVHLAPESGYFINALGDRAFRMGLAEGALNIRIPRLEDGETIEVESPYGTFRLLRAGSYRVDVQPEANYASVTVRSGAAEAIAGTQTFDVPAGRRAMLTGKPATVELLDAPPLDAWDEWCAARDEAAERGYEASQQYITWDVSGASDLAQYGDWVADEGGGWCWTPRALPAGWAPYRFGHWVFRQPWGWTWVDNLPWGFAPSHWGRWKRLTTGWGWKPDPERHPKYSPANVAFSSAKGSRLISWVPLAPGERHDGRGAYRNRDAMTTATQNEFAASKPIGAARVLVLDRGMTQFTERTAEIMPTREAVLGSQPHPAPPIARGNPEPVAPTEESRRSMVDERRDEQPRPAPRPVLDVVTVPPVESYHSPDPRPSLPPEVHHQVETPRQPDVHRAPEVHHQPEVHHAPAPTPAPPPAEAHRAAEPARQSSPAPTPHVGGKK